VFRGNFVDGKKDGFGMLEHKDSSKYVGWWKADKKHGRGYFEDTKGAKRHVVCENDMEI
jgi:hypothetical protein